MKREKSLLQLHKLCLEKNLVFVTFKLPLQDAFTTYIQTSNQVTEWQSLKNIPDKEGFLMAPFDPVNGKKYIHLKPDLVFDDRTDPEKFLKAISFLPSGQPTDWSNDMPEAVDRDKYIDQINAIKKSISRGNFQKAVLSRILMVNDDCFHKIPEMFQKLSMTHPNAFVYLFKAGADFWMGASPEPLLRLAGGQISTVSLAGTRPISDDNMELNKWNPKEVLEQEYVTRYIHDILRSFNIRDYNITSPYVKKAGNLLHLRTDFSFQYENGEIPLWDFVEALHPTPAVAGQPKESAISLIKSLEEHKREYYTGYLGPVGPGEHIDLFVNLRCMKITPSCLSLYIGGGITLESVPEDEWEETEWKAEALLDIIQCFSGKKEPQDAA